MLRGADTQNTRRPGHRQLSTHGRLRGHPNAQLLPCAREATLDALPSYLVFNDCPLERIAARRPGMSAESRALQGMGDRRATELKPVLLEVTRGAGP